MTKGAVLAALLAGYAQAAIAGQPLPVDRLSDIRAGDATPVTIANRQNVAAKSSDNVITADSLVSGGVSFSQNAFSGFSGIGNIVVNTGNNNAIQGTLSVTVVGSP